MARDCRSGDADDAAERAMNGPLIRRVVAAVLVVLALGGAALWLLGRDDASRVALPAPRDAATTAALRTYLMGKGRPLPSSIDVLPADLSPAPADKCAALSASLQRISPPDDLGALAQRVPDPEVADAFGNVLIATVRYVGVCRDGAAVDDAADRVDYAREVLRRMLIARGVTT